MWFSIGVKKFLHSGKSLEESRTSEARSKISVMDLKKAIVLQERLASKLAIRWEGGKINLLAGADFGYELKNKKIGAIVVVFTFPELEIVEVSEARRDLKLPYIPGFLAFREGPAFFDAFRKIRNKPDITLVDGNGIAHPRRMGLASFIGVVLNIATIGCAKSPFFPINLPHDKRGAYTIFRNRNREKVGFCLRTRTGVKPIFVSPGHRIDFIRSKQIVLSCSKFRIPEPLREAHRLAQRMFAS